MIAMEVLVRLSESPDDWGVVELQGELNTKGEIGYDGLRIGDLHYTTDSNASLIIGHHLLTGTVVKLVPPIAVLEKDASEEQPTQYTVIGFIKKKILFKNRPKPLVSATNTGSLDD